MSSFFSTNKTLLKQLRKSLSFAVGEGILRGRVYCLKGLPEERAIALAQYMIEKGATVRSTAKEFKISKSTVHKDVSERLPKLNPALYAQVKAVLELNKAERHMRGGMATRMKYQSISEKKGS